MTSCCWGYRHELLGIVLLVLATILTLITGNGFGIFAMFIVGLGLCCHKCFSHRHCCHTDDHCHMDDEECVIEPKPVKKTRSKKTKV